MLATLKVQLQNDLADQCVDVALNLIGAQYEDMRAACLIFRSVWTSCQFQKNWIEVCSYKCEFLSFSFLNLSTIPKFYNFLKTNQALVLLQD